MIENYIFAGIDFIINKKNEIYFIEANSSPGALKEFKKIDKYCKPVKELCKFLNIKYKKLAVISKKKWGKARISKKFRTEFKGDIYVCRLRKNEKLMLKGDGHLIDRKGRKIMPDVVLRVAAGRPYAQEKAGIKIINPTCILNTTKDKLKSKKAVEKYTKIKTPKYFIANKKSDIKKILIKNKELFAHGFVLKPQTGQKSQKVFILDSYEEIPKNFRIREPFLVEEIIQPCNLFKKEYFEVRSMAINGKYTGSMLFVSPNRPMHLFTEGRTVKIPKKIENKIKGATELVVKAIDKYALKNEIPK